MPFKSQAQRRKFAVLMLQGKISQQTFEEWNRETGGAKLPEHVGSERPSKPSPKGQPKSSSKSANAAKLKKATKTATARGAKGRTGSKSAAASKRRAK